MSALKHVTAPGAPANPQIYSQAVVTGNIVFCSGSIGLDPTTKQFNSDTIEGQTEQTLKNLTAVITAAGASLSSVAKVTIFLVDMGHFNAVNAIYTKHFPSPFPARTCIAVKALPLGALIEIEATAVLADK